MAKPFRLKPLVNLAEERSEEAAQILAKLRLAWQQAESKLEQLKSYLEEYRRRLQEHTQTGFTMNQWRDFQAFIGKLEGAIQAQSEEVERCRQRWEVGQVNWQAREREVKAYKTLEQRHDAAERKLEERQDQRVQDEFAGQLHRRRDAESE